MSTYYSFEERLIFSKGIVAATCVDMIREMIPGCTDVRATDRIELDKLGIDYVATLRRGAIIYIDHKVREAGCSRYWQLRSNGLREPEIALELWSVRPTDSQSGKVGWTLDEAKLTHYTLHTFDVSDCRDVFLLPFQLLRKAYRQNFTLWNATFKHGIQDSGTWYSECVFVPIDVVFSAIRAAMHTKELLPPAEVDGSSEQLRLF